MVVAMMLVVVLVHRRALHVGAVLTCGLGSSARALKEADADGGNQTTSNRIAALLAGRRLGWNHVAPNGRCLKSDR